MRILNILVLLVLVTGCAEMHMPMGDSKRPVCHKGKTLYVDESAVAAHVRHGDYGRACYGERKEPGEHKDSGKSE
jgi:hypothetical protein